MCAHVIRTHISNTILGAKKIGKTSININHLTANFTYSKSDRNAHFCLAFNFAKNPDHNIMFHF